jgi:hypothetical protein
VFDIIPDDDLARAFLTDTSEVFQMFGFNVDLLMFHGEEEDMDHDDHHDEESNVWYECSETPDYLVGFCFEQWQEDGSCAMAVHHDGMTVIDTCDSFAEYRWDSMDFNWYGSTDECHIDENAGDCMENIASIEGAEGCYFQQRYNQCTDMDECVAVIAVNGEYMAGTCQELSEMMGVPYGEDAEDQEEEEMSPTGAWKGCMDMYADEELVTRCWYLEDETSC